MKLPFVLPFWWFAILFGMDKPPYPIEQMRKSIEEKRDDSSYQDMPQLEGVDRHHHQHTSKHLEGTIGDVKIDIMQNETLSKSTDTDDSNKEGYSTKFVAIISAATGITTALIGAGATLAAVKLAGCNK